MEIKFGLISADSHAAFARDDFTSRMSTKKWGDKIPQVVEFKKDGEVQDGWSLYGQKPGAPRGFQPTVCNCPALMGEPFPHWPKRWEEVPRMAFDPSERLKALDIDGVDAEVLFPNPPGGNYYQFKDAEYEFDTLVAYNDILADWTRVSDRFLPLISVPYLSPPDVIAREIERSVKNGHCGVNLAGKMPKGLPHIADPHWYPLWDICEQLGIPIHFHGSANIGVGDTAKVWKGYSTRQQHSASTSTSAVTPAQIVPQLIFTGVTERFPHLKVVFAEAGIGGLNYLISTCDHEWETHHLWTEGLTTRPSDIVHRQMYVNFWFEAEGIKLRHDIGIDNIMWESDFPHVAAYYPNSWKSVERVLDGVPSDERRKLLYENALRVYQIKATVAA
jgi:predicted TIM-barrel fold metal-dependent hydrolase